MGTMDLLTTETLERWTQNDPGSLAEDPLALELIDKVSQLICFIGGHNGSKLDAAGVTIPEWTLDPGPAQAPIDVQMVALQVIKRSFENPTQVTSEGNVGPLGGDSHLDAYALFADFTESERATIARYNPDGDPDGLTSGGEIFTLSTTRGDDSYLKPVTIYVSDNLQVNMTPDQSAYPSWDIPLYNPGDIGDPNNYDDDYDVPDDSGPFANGGA